MTGFSTKVRQLIYKRAKGRCEGCGLRNQAYQIHHRRPRGMGGSDSEQTNTPANALYLCGGCHRLTESERAWGITSGWLVTQGTDPATVRVRLFDGWFFLDAVGKRQEAAPL